jgi:Domain of unknown function (DUF4157)
MAEAAAPPVRRPARARPPLAPTRAPVLGSPRRDATGPGLPLPGQVARPISASFGVDLSSVRLHADADAGAATRALGARAVTVGRHIFLGRGERPTDLPLIAHEVAHVVQQQGAPSVQLWTPVAGDHYEREAQSAAAAVGRRERYAVRLRTRPRPQRLGISDVLDYFADKANHIPGFRMFTIVLGVNPINWSRVERTPANILRAVVELIPGGGIIRQALDSLGVFERAGVFVEQQIRKLGMTGQAIKDAIWEFIDSLSWRDIFRLGSVWDRAKRIFTRPIEMIIDFVTSSVVGILKIVKDAALRPLARLAQRTRAYDLLKAVLGEDPITGERVPQTADAVIGGFMKLINQEEVWNNIKRARAIPRAWAWFKGVLSGLLGFVRAIPRTFISALQQLEFADFIIITRAFSKLARVFGGFVLDFISWAGRQVLGLLQIIFEVVAPSVVPYLRKAQGAFTQILRNPVRFVRTLVRAGRQGFSQFRTNFLRHLRTSLIQWVTGALSGASLYLPKSLDIREIIKFVLSVLGLTWANLRGKLARVIGNSGVEALEKGFDLVVTLVKEGPAAAWEKIKEELSNLQETVTGEVMSFVRTSVIEQAVPKLLSFLTPAGAFIQAIIAIYNTVMFFVERLTQIAQVVRSFVDSIAEIAAGAVGGAANRVEQTMAGLLTLVISFLARFAGLGNVSDAVLSVIKRIREPIDKALDKVVDWIVGSARRLGRLVAQAGVPQDPRERLRLGMRAAVAAANRFAGRRVGAAALNPLLAAVRIRFGFTSLVVKPAGQRWAVEGVVNPDKTDVTEVERGSETEGTSAPPAFAYRISGVGRVQGGFFGQRRSGALAPPPASKFVGAYVGTVPIKFDKPASRVAQEYLKAFPPAAAGAVEEASMRFSLVLGVNAIDDLASLNQPAVTSKVAEGVNAPYPWAMFGMLWTPRWVDAAGRPAPLATVRTAYSRLPASQRSSPFQPEVEGVNSSTIPFGGFRTRVHQYPAVAEFAAALRNRAQAVFVHVSDPDTVNFNPQPSAGGVPQALFQRFDAILASLVADVRSRRAQGSASDGGDPIVATGGYEFELTVPPAEQVRGQTSDLRVRLSAQLDMAVRQAMAAVDPRSVYFPEPNLLIEVTPATVKARFGGGRLESSRLLRWLEGRGLRPRLVFDLRASLATAAAARFGLGDARAVSTWAQIDELTPAELRAIVGGAQSHAGQLNWARQISSSYGLNPNTALEPLNRLWEVYFPVSSALCGFDPARLRDGVANAGFTSLPRYADDRLPRERLLASITGWRGRTPAEAAELTERIVRLAREGGLALGNALAEVFRRAKSPG